jgi:hypothetical protein
MIRATDLFGNEGILPASALRPEDEIHAPELFDHAAEAAAFVGERPVSQERAEVVAPPATAPLRCEWVARGGARCASMDTRLLLGYRACRDHRGSQPDPRARALIGASE